ncbi:MAG: 50S ribosomal protein L30 [Propionibacteriaceae bacterium]|nr:50S ribosomal protein L30 [Propionibacteriaceae bacterium]
MATKKENTTIKVKQIKSGIGGNCSQRGTLKALGLRRIGQVVEKEDRPEIRGMVDSIPHLVTIIEEGE